MQLWQYCLLVTAKSLYMFRKFSASIISSTKTVVAATGACHMSGWYISSKDVQGRLPLPVQWQCSDLQVTCLQCNFFCWFSVICQISFPCRGLWRCEGDVCRYRFWKSWTETWHLNIRTLQFKCHISSEVRKTFCYTLFDSHLFSWPLKTRWLLHAPPALILTTLTSCPHGLMHLVFSERIAGISGH